MTGRQKSERQRLQVRRLSVSMKLIRESERVAVLERGARLGNSGCLHVSEAES